MDGRIWYALQLFAALFEKMPVIGARTMLPSAVLLLSYLVLKLALPQQPELAFVLAFVLCQMARFVLRWPGQFAREARRTCARARRKRLLGVFLIPAVVLFASHNPDLCQHVPSLISAGFVILFAVDMLDRSHSTARAYWPGSVFVPYARELSQAMLVLHLTYILLNETMIKAVSLDGWLVFYALLPLLHHVLLTALFRTVFWLVPNPERR